MAKSTKRKFPLWLPPPDQKLLRKLGARLGEIRRRRKSIEIPEEDKLLVKDLEKGKFQVTVGYLRKLLQDVYAVTLEDLLREFYVPHEDRLFDRDLVYSLRWDRTGNLDVDTPFLIGGDPKRFLWAVPMRYLKGQNIFTEYLALPPRRKRAPAGVTTGKAHPGVEILIGIFGRVRVEISGGGTRDYKDLSEGQAVHLHSKFRHSVINNEINSPALLLVIRSFESISAKDS
jgi:hypothetical protein